MTEPTIIVNELGPWTASVEKRPAPASGHWYVVTDADENGLGEFYGDDHDLNVAHLRLAAAAPDLYEALNTLFADPQFQVAIGGNPNMVEALMARCNAALAKARGEA